MKENVSLEYCASLVGKTRDEATKINMANGYHTAIVGPSGLMTADVNLKRIRLYLNENNIVEHAVNG